MAVAQRILEKEPEPAQEAVPQVVAKFQLADFTVRGNWLFARLARRWPHISEATFSGRSRAWVNSNSHLFIKAANGVALFRIIRGEIDIEPICEEVFLFTDQPKAQSSPSERAAVALYREAVRWSRNLGCAKVIIDRTSDHGGARMVALMHAEEDIEVSLPVK